MKNIYKYNMDKIIQILEAINCTSSRTGKENILKQNGNNDAFKTVLQYAMNPFYIYGIGSKAFNKSITGVNEFINIIDLLDYLRMNSTGTDAIKQKVNRFINAQPQQYQDWYKRIILKDLRIGITAKTVNKIYGNIIPVFDVMLAKPFDRLFNEVACEYKIDGVRAIAVKQNNVTHLFTRNGKLIEGYTDIENDINNLKIIDNIVLDGEILSGDYTGTMNNLFNKSNNKQGIYNIFDILTIDEFYNGKSKNTYVDRKNELHNLGIINNGLTLNFMDNFCYLKNPTIKELNKVTEEAVMLGYEGIMIKNAEGLYECKRSIEWQKMKPFFTEEFPIIDFESGTGKYANVLGKVIIDVNGVAVGVGSGWTDEQRNDIWNNKDNYLGRIIEVQYQEKIEKTGSLRFPTVKGFREF